MPGAAATLILLAAFAAGFIDAIVGGGGLIQVPALLAVLPEALPATLLGTSKLAGSFGTASAAVHYARNIDLPWRRLLPAAAVALIASVAGAATVSRLPAALFRPLVPVLLSAVLLYTLLNRRLGERHAPVAASGRREAGSLALLAGIGFYDGFFGPGAGSLLMLLFVRMYGFDFLHAAAAARVVNLFTNVSALAWFGAHGAMLWPLGLAMAAANLAGAQLGTRLALRRGRSLVRGLFLLVVAALIARTAWVALRPLLGGS